MKNKKQCARIVHMSSKPILKIDWATYEAAKFACTRFHYSKVAPAGKLVKVGVWEGETFIGVVLFSRGANNNIGKPYGLDQTECCELTRVALTGHKTEVTRIVKIAMSFLKANSPGLRLIVSYADPLQGHHGGIYQGGNWVYAGLTSGDRRAIWNGKKVHKRTVHSLIGRCTKADCEFTEIERKHIYLMPLDEEMKKQIAHLSKPYPKRAKNQDVECPSTLGGEVPTCTLQLC